MHESMHKSVLLHESIDALNLSSKKVFVDATYGGGGHTKEVLKKFPKIKAITIDRDSETGADITGSFADIDKLLNTTRPDAILLDLGISSDQLETSGRGFSFQKDEPLDMRMGKTGLTAADILNSFDEDALELILRGFGEEKYSYRIAKEIVRSRELRPFRTTGDLVQAIESVVPMGYKRGRINPATRTFQALRIAVNEELTALESGLQNGFEILNKNGRFAVISFHSLEDRLVKNFFREKAKSGEGKLINKKPIVPSEEEIMDNPRARSAKLRILEKI